MGGPQPIVAPAPGPAQVRVIDVAGLGPVLADKRGYVLYMFVADSRHTVSCVDECAGSWPPMVSPPGTKPVAGPGADPRLVGSLLDQSGQEVTTYAGWPLYTYASDVEPGQATGHGIDLNGAAWYVLRPSGAVVVPADRPEAREEIKEMGGEVE